MSIFRNNSIHFLINFIATGTAGFRFPRRFGLFFHLKCSNYGAGGSVLFQLPFLSHWVICFTLIELWLLPAGVDSLSELVSLSSFRAFFFFSSHFSLWSPGPVRGGWARRREREHGGPGSADDELQLPSTTRQTSEPNGRTLHLCPCRSAQAPLPEKSRH